MGRFDSDKLRDLFRERNHYYQQLIAEQRSRLTAPVTRERQLVAQSLRLRLAQASVRVSIPLAVLLGVLGLGLTVSEDDPAVFLLTVICCAVVLAIRFKLSRGMAETKEALLSSDVEYVRLVADARAAQREIDIRWDRYNVNYQDYPPDWRWRKEIVRKRDGFTCTKCGWPHGFERLRRNLHVHHRVPLSSGGNNGLDNLTTLCHVCHRGEEGVGHAGIKYRRRGRRSGRRP
jgi:5-methylcytosine-specific restriction endonuclease McrA